MDRTDGVFVSRIALESAVYSSQCIVVGDEILAVNLVDVTKMSLDDVVIIMSIPRRLVLTTRRQKSLPRAFGPSARGLDHKPAPVVVFKGDPDHPHEYGYRNDLRPNVDGFGSPSRRDGPHYRDSRTLTWDRNPKPDRSDPKYFPVNSLPRQRVPNTTLSPPREEWNRRDDPNYQGDYPGGRDMPPPMHALPSYAPPPPVVTEQPRGHQGQPPKEPAHFKPYKHPYGPPPGVDGPMGGKPGDEYYPPAGYPQHDVGGDAYLRPSSRLLEPPVQSPYGPSDTGSYRKPAGPQVIQVLGEFFFTNPTHPLWPWYAPKVVSGLMSHVSVTQSVQAGTGSLQRKSYTLGHQAGYRATRSRNFSGDARSNRYFFTQQQCPTQSPTMNSK